MKNLKICLALIAGCFILFSNPEEVHASSTTDITESTQVKQAEIDLNVQVDSTFTIGIPIETDIDEKTGTGSYQISVKGDIDPRYKLVVAPVDEYTTALGDTTANINFLLKDKANALSPKDDLVVNIISDKIEFICTDINPDTETLVNTSLSLADGKLTAGIWQGTIRYEISLILIDAGAGAAIDNGEGSASSGDATGNSGEGSNVTP